VTVALLSSCYRNTVTTEPITHPFAERRLLAAPDDPVVTSDWTVDGRVVRGTLSWQSCISEKSWTTSERKTLHREPNWVLGGVLTIGGLGLFGAGMLTRDTESKTTCDFSACSLKEPDNSVQTVMAISGLGAAVAGSMILLSRSSERTEEGAPQEHHKKERVPCIRPADLGGLELSLSLPNHRPLPLEMNGAQRAIVHLPNDVDLSSLTGEWPVVVSRVPRGARDFLSEGEVLGAVRR
jgi:hypothetical protein